LARVAGGVLLLAAAVPAWAGTIVYVDHGAAPGGDGSSWSSAFAFLQDGLAAASRPGLRVSEIRVSGGTYLPDRDAAHPLGTGNRAATFDLVSGVTLAGGYAGPGAPDPDLRDPQRFRSILSGDLAGNDGGPQGTDENAFHIVTAWGTSPGTALDGFLVDRGNAEGETYDGLNGAGILVLFGSVLVRDCQFRSHLGGAAAALVSDVAFQRCRFAGCVTGGSGGAIKVQHAAVVTLSLCRFEGNQAGIGGGIHVGYLGTLDASDCAFIQNVGRGGAIWSQGDVTARRCRFEGNSGAGDPGGAVSISGAGGVFAPADLFECLFVGNNALRGGGIYNFSGVLTVVNCVFRDNTASFGGGIALWTGENVQIINCTLEGNSGGGAAGIYSNTSFGSVKNCVVWGNAGAQIGTGIIPLQVTFCDVMGGYSGNGNINLDPLFQAAGTGGLRLLPGSPCLDRGSNAAVPAGVAFDFDGQPRIVEADGDGFAEVDMGAFEYAFHDCDGNGVDDALQINANPAIDCDVNGRPDACDLAGGAADCDGNGALDGCDLAQGPSPDCNGNGAPDACDLAAGASLDCDGNSAPDECQIDQGDLPDCDGDGVPDGCAIAAGSAQDCNGNGLPDPCDVAAATSFDVNLDMIPDECQDCNGNGTLDPEDLARGTSADCNGNAVPDECEVTTVASFASAPLGPFGAGQPQSFQVTRPPLAVDDVEVRLTAFADLSHFTEAVDVFLNQGLLGRLFELGAGDCPTPPDEAALTVPSGAFNDAVDQAGVALFTAVATGPVDAGLCGGATSVAITVTYAALDPEDLDGNGIPDECECPADLDGDGAVNVSDLATLLSAWGDISPDFDGDGLVGLGDLLELTLDWGACP
jgi:hypothetical protein